MSDTTNDWIEWHGGEQPVPDGTLVEVEFRSGGSTEVNAASRYRWDHWDTSGDIIRYRVIREAEKPAPLTAANSPHGYALVQEPLEKPAQEQERIAGGVRFIIGPGGSEGTKPAHESAVDGKIEAALRMVAALCNKKREWTMSVPARPDYDPDLVIASALTDARKELEALRAEVAVLKSGDVVMVPREPSEAMTYACRHILNGDRSGNIAAPIYKAMLAAAEEERRNG